MNRTASAIRQERAPRSVGIYRREADGWIQCGSHISVIPAEATWERGS